MLEKIIDKTKEKDILFLSGIIMNIMNERKGKQKDSILPELFSTLGIDNTINLIKFFGGEEIKIPSHEEMFLSFLVIVVYYKKKIEGKDWDAIKDEINIKDINPHTLGKLVSSIDKKIKIEMEELQGLGIEEYFTHLSKR